MIRHAILMLSLAAVTYVAPSIAFAQEAPPYYVADPGVYKVIFEDPMFRVIEATWRPGQIDKPHSHLIPAVVYSLDNCRLKLTSADGTTRIVNNKAGHAMSVPFTASHTAQNIGRSACRVLFFERK
jgi:hypothetical protein